VDHVALPNLGLSAREVLTTTRSVRKRLDLTRPVEREVLHDAIEVACQAPSGSNAQLWHWLIVDDPIKKAGLAELYRLHADPYLSAAAAMPRVNDDIRSERADAVTSSAIYLRDHLHEVPVLVIPCIWGRLPDDAGNAHAAGFYGSILPAAWSFMLALRTRGIGSSWTTLHLGSEREAASLLGIPYERCSQVGLFPVAYTLGTDFRPAPRLPLDQIIQGDCSQVLARLPERSVDLIVAMLAILKAGGAYVPGMSDYVVMVRGRARAFLASHKQFSF